MTVGVLITIIGMVFYFKWSYHSIKDLVENKINAKPISLAWFILTSAYLIIIVVLFLLTYWDHKLF